MEDSRAFYEFKFCSAGRTTAINFREIAAELEHAETMQEFQHLIQHWMERGTEYGFQYTY